MDGPGSSTHLDALDMKYLVSESLELLQIHKKAYQGVANEGMLWDHCTSLTHGLQFLEKFFEFSRSEDLKQRIIHLVSNVKQNLDSLTFHGKVESLVVLDREYSDIREQMKNVILKPGTNEYDAMYPDDMSKPTNMMPYFHFLYLKMVELVSSDCKADQKDIRKMLTVLLEFEYHRIFIPDAEFFIVFDRATCFIYLSLIGKMDCEMELSFKSKYIDRYVKMNLASESHELLEIHKKAYQGVSNETISWDHWKSLKYGLQFLARFFKFSRNKELKQRIKHLDSNVTQKLHSLTHLRNDESLVMKLDREYSDLREQMKNDIIKPGTNEYDFIFSDISFRRIGYKQVNLFLSKEMEELRRNNRPMRKELEDIRKMLTFLEPFSYYADNSRLFTVIAKENSLAAVLERVVCCIYLASIEKLDSEMVLCLKNGMSRLKIEEIQRMSMHLTSDINSRNSKKDISELLSLMTRNKECYLGAETLEGLEDHFISIEHGLQFLNRILELSRDKDLKLHVEHLFYTVEAKLKSLTHQHNQEDNYLIVTLEHAYEDLRKVMQNVVIKPSNDYVSGITTNFLLEEIRILVTSSCIADKIAPIMNELGELSNNLTSLRLLMDYAFSVSSPLATKKEEEEIFVAQITFLDGVASLIYLSIVGKLNEDMLVSLRKNISLLIEEYNRKEISFVLGRGLEGDLDSVCDRSISLLMREEEYHIVTMDEVMVKDHIMSLKHGIEFLKWFRNIYKGRYFECRITLLAIYVNQTLIWLTHKQMEESMNMDMNAYADLRKEMKEMIINQATGKYDILFPDSNMISHVIGDTNFLIEEITTLVTSNCKADQISPLKEELQHLQKVLTSLKPLDLYNGGIYERVSTIHHKATIFIYLSFVGERDLEIWIKSNISTTIKEMDVLEMYTKILNQDLNIPYLEEDLYLLENLMLLLKGNVDYFNDASSKLHEALIDIHNFLRGISSNVILRKHHLLQASFQAIFSHSIPIVCSCYLEHTEIDISVELNCVLNLIKDLKSEAQEIKLYYFPRVDDLGFLELFLGHLDYLLENPEISMKEEIRALHFEVHSLLFLATKTNQELDKTPWNDLINMAYQAEYILDLNLASNYRDLSLILSLSKIIEQLQNIRADANDAVTLDLSHLYKSLPTQGILDRTTQLSNNDAIVGLQKETEKITEYLLKGENKLDVISIVGMAGVGKTTLASSLYKTLSDADHFDILAWCAVSQSYQYTDLFHKILDQVNASDKSDRSKLDDEALADHLWKSLKKRRYLIVLDDIWDTKLLKDLKRYLPDDGVCSRILITTRNSDVAYQIKNLIQLHGLSKENSWELFQKKMLQKENLSDGLLKISEGIVENCKGLPLSIVIIAGILADIERTETRWNEIGESVNSIILSDPQGKCKALLELSYNHLPNHLRSCFLYLGSFPEDQEISVNQLITMWIGEALVRDTESRSAEEVAKKNIDDLIAKSLVIPAKERYRGGVKAFRLHDLLREFCLDKAKEMHFSTVLDYKNHSQPLQDPKRIVINGTLNNDLRFSCHSIRSMIWFGRLYASNIENRIESCDMVLLQVLAVDVVESNSFPNISSLVHLRYLALGLPIWRNSALPSSINRLQNLQILILRCTYVVEVPDLIWDMGKLRHVDISPSILFQVDCNRLQNSSVLLENLRYLSNSRVSWGDSEWLCKLSGLERLCCVFFADGLEEGDDDLEEDDDIIEDEDLEEDDVLVEDDNLKEDDEVGKDDITEVDEDVEDNFQMLSFNSHLTSLKVRNAANREPIFMTTFQLPNSLRKLSLSKFFLRSDGISNIGRALPQLEVCKIYSCYVPSCYEWKVNDEDFPKLKVLKLRDLEISKWNASKNSFPSLEQLWVEKCDYLETIPLDFGDLPNLLLISVRECPPSVDDSAKEIKMQREEQNISMEVHIYPRK